VRDDQELFDTDFDYWSFEPGYVERDSRALASWKYTGSHGFDEDMRVRVTAEYSDFLMIPPFQMFGNDIQQFDSPADAYREAIEYVEELDVDDISLIDLGGGNL